MQLFQIFQHALQVTSNKHRAILNVRIFLLTLTVAGIKLSRFMATYFINPGEFLVSLNYSEQFKDYSL